MSPAHRWEFTTRLAIPGPEALMFSWSWALARGGFDAADKVAYRPGLIPGRCDPDPLPILVTLPERHRRIQTLQVLSNTLRMCWYVQPEDGEEGEYFTVYV